MNVMLRITLYRTSFSEKDACSAGGGGVSFLHNTEVYVQVRVVISRVDL